MKMMVLKVSFLILGMWLVGASEAQARGASAVREAGESFEGAKARVSKKTFQTRHDFSPLWPNREPMNMSVPMDELNIDQIPEVPSLDLMTQEFKYVRDSRFITSPRSDFPRRATWLFPDDGCYARAEEAAIKLMEHSFVTPKKLFAFGDLTVKTPNSLSGVVSWWYHVAVAYRFQRSVFVFDPAIEPSRPLTLQEWHERLGGNSTDINYTICEARTYDAEADCLLPLVTSTTAVEDEERGYFQSEWTRLQRLNRNPEKELGEFPPWLQVP